MIINVIKALFLSGFIVFNGVSAAGAGAGAQPTELSDDSSLSLIKDVLSSWEKASLLEGEKSKAVMELLEKAVQALSSDYKKIWCERHVSIYKSALEGITTHEWVNREKIANNLLRLTLGAPHPLDAHSCARVSCALLFAFARFQQGAHDEDCKLHSLVLSLMIYIWKIQISVGDGTVLSLSSDDYSKTEYPFCRRTLQELSEPGFFKGKTSAQVRTYWVEFLRHMHEAVKALFIDGATLSEKEGELILSTLFFFMLILCTQHENILNEPCNDFHAEVCAHSCSLCKGCSSEERAILHTQLFLVVRLIVSRVYELRFGASLFEVPLKDQLSVHPVSPNGQIA